MKLVKQEQGSMAIKLIGVNLLHLNWKDGLIEIYNNGEKKYCIDMNK
jgi:hypothetical protein